MKSKLGQAVVTLFLARATAASTCSPETFSTVSLPKGEILSIETELSHTSPASQSINTWPVLSNVTTLTCQVNIQYTHPGWNDKINTYVWLPVNNWNGRFVGLGGGGWATGRKDDLGLPVSRGYAAVVTDGGHAFELSDDLPSWALVGKESINWYNLHNFASVSLDDAATLGKNAVKAFYGRAHEFSYWNGCSTGGRQGFMMAQRYPDQYDGILASAPVINWDKFLIGVYWPPFAMSLLDYYPPNCELEAITKAVVEACDAKDGLEDGVVTWPWACNFNATTVVGQTIPCGNGTKMISDKAAELASMIWHGPVSEDGSREWYGLSPSAPLIGTASTTCSSSTECKPEPFRLAPDWIQIFLLEDSTADLSTLTHEQYSRLFRISVNRYESVIGTRDTDLTDFKRAGGKIVAWHGMDDQYIPFNGTVDYYEKVLQRDPEAADFFRFFPAPGVQHCRDGLGWFPGDAFDSLVDWVENGNAPDTLIGRPRETAEDDEREAPLCAYPNELHYLGGNPDVASSFECR